MKQKTYRLLKRVSKEGELPLNEAMLLCARKINGHKDLYPLALLVESGYLGLTYNITPPENAEEMREFVMARYFYMNLLPRDGDGTVTYEGMKMNGANFAESEKVFVKAKGFLYLADVQNRRNERIISYIIGFLSALTVVILSEKFVLNTDFFEVLRGTKK